MATLECPSCGRQSPGSAERCAECGLIFTPGIRRQAMSGGGVEVGSRRRLLDLVLLAAVVVVAVLLYQGRDRPDIAATQTALEGAGPEPALASDVTDSAAREAPADRAAQRVELPRSEPRSEPAAPPPARRVDTATAAPARPVRQPTDTQPVVSPARTDTTPPAAPRPTTAPVAPADTPSLAAPPPSEGGGPVQRYARTWVNVRAGRSGGTALVRTLRPGEAVLVDSLDQGWYRIVVDGRTDGYVDRSYLDEAAQETVE